MRNICAAFVVAVVLPSAMLLVGCGDAASDSKPVMVAPDVPPAEANKDSMNAYLKDHPGAAKKAAPGMAPK